MPHKYGTNIYYIFLTMHYTHRACVIPVLFQRTELFFWKSERETEKTYEILRNWFFSSLRFSILYSVEIKIKLKKLQMKIKQTFILPQSVSKMFV